jgi:multicomponent Na+:H+ antiporter subunit E
VTDSSNNSVPWSRVLLLLAVLAVIWLLWSGLFLPLLLGLGVLSCVLTCYLAYRMGYFENDFYALHLNIELIGYWIWLSREIVRSSLDVARVVLTPKIDISPRVIEIDASHLHPVYQAILGNSITLTPGTLTLDLHEGIIRVHSLTSEGADELIASEMAARVTALSKS